MSRVYLCEGTTIVGTCEIGVESVVYPRVCIECSSSADADVSLGERNVVEERTTIRDSTIQHSNTISVGCTIINSSIGSFNTIAPHCQLINSQIGNLCSISSGVKLENAVLGDNTVVYLLPSPGEPGGGRVRERWHNWASRVLPAEQLRIKFQQAEAYHRTLTDKDSSYFVGKHFALKG